MAEQEKRTENEAGPGPARTHGPGDLAAPAQAREGTGPRQMTRCFPNTTGDRLTRVPGTTVKTKYIKGGRNRVTNRD